MQKSSSASVLLLSIKTIALTADVEDKVSESKAVGGGLNDREMPPENGHKFGEW